MKERNDAAVAAGRPPGYDGRCRALTADERAAKAAEGLPRSIRFRTPDEGVSSFTDLIRGEVKVEWSLIHDFVIVRSDGAPIFFLANAVDDLDMGITHVIRGEDLIDSTHRVLALRHALVGATGAADDLQYAHLPAHRRRRVAGQALEAARRGGARGLRRRRLPPRSAHQLPRAARVGPGRRRPRGDGRAPSSIAAVRPRPGDACSRRLRPRQARLAQRRMDPSARPRRPGRAACSRWREARFGADVDPEVVAAAAAIAQERAVTLVQIVDQMAFLFVDATTSSRSNPNRGRRSSPPSASARSSTRSSAHVEKCDWNHDAVDFRGVLTELGLSKKQIRGVMGSCYAVVEGVSRGLPLFESIVLLGRDRTLARLASRATDPLGLSRGPVYYSGGTFRGWCNRQHSRFWSCLWGFESSPPSSQQATHLAPSSSGLGRRPLKAVTAVRICSGLHPEPGPQGPGSSRFREVGDRRRGTSSSPPRAWIASDVRCAVVARSRHASSQVAHGFSALSVHASCARAASTRVRDAFVVRSRCAGDRVDATRAISTTSRLRCRTLVASCAHARAYTRARHDRVHDREAGKTRTQQQLQNV